MTIFHSNLLQIDEDNPACHYFQSWLGILDNIVVTSLFFFKFTTIFSFVFVLFPFSPENRDKRV